MNAGRDWLADLEVECRMLNRCERRAALDLERARKAAAGYAAMKPSGLNLKDRVAKRAGNRDGVLCAA